MRKLTILAVLALVACNENAGWNPNYTMNASPYGDYQRSREAALLGQGNVPAVIPVQLPVKAPTAADLTRAGKPQASPQQATQATTVAPAARPAATGPYANTPSVLTRFALAERHDPGTAVYPRPDPSPAKAERACRSHANSAAAQTAFIAAGGPIIDPLGMDPDGDGFVCGWDPRPYRQSAL